MSKTTVRKIGICLTKEMDKQLNQMMEENGENSAKIISRALNIMYHCTRVNIKDLEDVYKNPEGQKIICHPSEETKE